MEIVLTPDEMRAADQATIADGTPGFWLMDRAAYACAVVALRMLGGSYGKRVVVVCGKGNNGGDGIGCARHLHDHGAHVTIFLLDGPTGDPAAHLKLLRHVRVEQWSREAFLREAGRSDLVVDAILGTGSSGEPRGDAAEAIASINDSGKRVLAVDIPSGVNSADGSVPGATVIADVTLAIQALKVGHVTTPGAINCGRVDVCDIGITAEGAHTFVPQASDVLGVLPELEPDTHKYRVGALAVLAGSAGMTGAAILVARGAIRAGAGLVILGVPASTLDIFEGAVIEAIKVPLPEAEGQLEAKAVDELSDRLEKCRALAIGPGLGRGPRAVAVVRRALDVALPLVCDGDGLWALSEIMRDEPNVLKDRAEPTILTPHSGEFAFLSGHAPRPDRVTEARDAAREWSAVVHLKGRRAITSSPAGDVWVNTTGNPGAATGGTGDVLTGIVASLVAQGAEAASATWAGAFLHGLSADIVAGRSGERSLAAGDLPEALPSAFRVLRRTPPPGDHLRTVVDDVYI
jgi:ADP-dependent NAD(P)H-hydrate dehydratase / NAD(P)H-hydrate epimerase